MADDGARTPTAYDEVPYPTGANPHTHPDSMAVLARLYGLTPPPPETCRVLEVGCGDGGNLLPMAAALPGARLHGFDLAGSVVARAQADAAALGLGNVTLEAADLMEVAERPEVYDYVIAHGFYTWTPQPVRDALLRLLERAVAPGGLVFMSYNVAQGCHIRRQLREAIEFQMRLTGVDRSDLEGVSECVRFLAEAAQDDQPYGRAVKAEAELWLKIGPSGTMHDILSPHYVAYRFHEVADPLGAHGLDYLGEGDSYALRRELFPAEIDEDVRRRAKGDRVLIEEIYDDLYARPFRLSVFRRREAHASEWERPLPTIEAALDMHATLNSEIGPDALAGSVQDGEWGLMLRARDGARARLGGEGLREVVGDLRAAYPASLPVQSFGRSPEVANALALLHSIGVVRLFTQPSLVVAQVSERPRAFPPAALYAQRDGAHLPRADHAVAQSLNASATRLVAQLDGSRTLEELATVAAEAGESAQDAYARVAADVARIAQAGLLVG